VQGLNPEQIRWLFANWGAPRWAALEAMSRPDYAEEFERHGAHVVEASDGLVPVFPPQHEEYCWQMVWAAVGKDSPADNVVHLPAQGDELDLSGDPYPPAQLIAAAKAYANGRTSIRKIGAAAGLKYKRARRPHSWLKTGAVFWDGQQLRTAPGYRFVNVAPDPDSPPLYRLIRR
jgi:hypothetical protein